MFEQILKRLTNHDAMVSAHELRILRDAVTGRDIASKTGRHKTAADLDNLFFSLLDILKPKLFIEAGAKDASVSKKVVAIVPGCRAIAYEANTDNYNHYKGAAADVEYVYAAVSDSTGNTTFNIRTHIDGKKVRPGTSGRESLRIRHHDGNAKYKTVTVPTVRLDDVGKNYKKNVVWIDVEGATDKVIKGGRSFLRKTSLALVELEDRAFWRGQWTAHKVMSELMWLGLIPVARDYQSLAQHNVMFVRDDVLQNPRVRRAIAEYFSCVV